MHPGQVSGWMNAERKALLDRIACCELSPPHFLEIRQSGLDDGGDAHLAYAKVRLALIDRMLSSLEGMGVGQTVTEQ